MGNGLCEISAPAATKINKTKTVEEKMLSPNQKKEATTMKKKKNGRAWRKTWFWNVFSLPTGGFFFFFLQLNLWMSRSKIIMHSADIRILHHKCMPTSRFWLSAIANSLSRSKDKIYAEMQSKNEDALFVLYGKERERGQRMHACASATKRQQSREVVVFGNSEWDPPTQNIRRMRG